MPIPVLAAAKWLCQHSGWTLTNLRLQKLLYLAHMFHLGMTDKGLVDGHFEAWELGPVHPKVYREVRKFGSSPIKPPFFPKWPDIKDTADGAPRYQVSYKHDEYLGAEFRHGTCENHSLARRRVGSELPPVRARQYYSRSRHQERV